MATKKKLNAKEYKKELKKVPEPFRTLGDGLVKGKTQNIIAQEMGVTLYRVKHLIKVMRKNADKLPLFHDYLIGLSD